MALEPRQFLGEHRHALPIRARHAGDVGAPEAALRAKRVDDLADVFVDVAIKVGFARIARPPVRRYFRRQKMLGSRRFASDRSDGHGLEGPVTDFALAVEEGRTAQGVAGLVLVEATWLRSRSSGSDNHCRVSRMRSMVSGVHEPIRTCHVSRNPSVPTPAAAASTRTTRSVPEPPPDQTTSARIPITRRRRAHDDIIVRRQMRVGQVLLLIYKYKLTPAQ